MVSCFPSPWLTLANIPNQTRDHEWNSYIQPFLLHISHWARVFCYSNIMLMDSTQLAVGSDGIYYNCVTAVFSSRRKWHFCPSLVEGGSWGAPQSSLFRLQVWWLLPHFIQGLPSSTDRHIRTLRAAGSQEHAVSIYPFLQLSLRNGRQDSASSYEKKTFNKSFTIFHSQS